MCGDPALHAAVAYLQAWADDQATSAYPQDRAAHLHAAAAWSHPPVTTPPTYAQLLATITPPTHT